MGVGAWYPVGFCCCIGAICERGVGIPLEEGVGVADLNPTRPLMLAPCEAEIG